MHYLLFSYSTIEYSEQPLTKVSSTKKVTLIHFGDYDSDTHLYVIEGLTQHVLGEYHKLKDKIGSSCKYIGEGDTHYELDHGTTWLWKQYIKQQGFFYIPTYSL